MSRYSDCSHTRKIEYWIFLACIIGIGICYHGVRALAVYGLSAVTAILTDFICLFLEKKSYKRADLANIGMALTMCMMFPATVPYSIVILSTIFAVAIGSHVFGYRKRYLFPPSAIGYLFALSCWKDEILNFPEAGEKLPLFHHQAELSNSMSYILLTENEIHSSWNQILMGTVHSPMGTGCIIMLAVGMVVMICRKQISLWACLGYLLGISISSFFMSVSIHGVLISCMTVFSMIFLIADPAVMPCRNIMAYVGALVTGLLSCYLISAYHLEYAPIVAVMLSIPLWRWLSKIEEQMTPEVEEDEEETEETTPLENRFGDEEEEDFEEEENLEEIDEITEEETFEDDDDFEDDDFDDLEDEPEEDTNAT
ncbi:MAG TPA: hypothetical protein DCO72_02210 [Ruminococcus sp.]|nr:hypothetical protein [Ruminococcus sp.]